MLMPGGLPFAPAKEYQVVPTLMMQGSIQLAAMTGLVEERGAMGDVRVSEARESVRREVREVIMVNAQRSL